MSTMTAALRCARRALLLSASLGTLAISTTQAQETAALRTVPSALLSIDQNRGTVVDRIVGEWGDSLAQSNTGISAEQLRATLTAMRSDYLLAASVAGSLEGLRNVVASSLIGSAPAGTRPAAMKVLGDVSDDLVYTPVVPCRVADTRPSQGGTGPIGTNSSKDFKVWVASGGFTAQGGSATNCNIPANPVAVVVNLTAVSPAGAGNFIVYPTGTPTFTSVLNYSGAVTALANGAIVPVCQPNCTNQLTVATNGAGADVIVDIVGYFAAPLATALQCTSVPSGSTSIAISADTLVTLPACATGYTRTGANCSGPANTPSAYLVETNATGCLFRNLSAVAPYNAIATSICCRIPGR